METQNLIYLLTCAINGTAPERERVAGMDLEALYQLAARHMLDAAAAPALEAAGVRDARFVRALEHSALKNAQMDMEMDAVFAELDAAGIWYMPLKGIVLQHLYPIYGMRQMSDHDILFDAERAEDVKAIMEGLGFTVKRYGTWEDDIYHKNPVSNFEMHRFLFGSCRDERLQAYYGDVQKRLLGEGWKKHLKSEDFYLYLIAHEYKHYSDRGTGLRSLLDTYVYLQKETLDMVYVTAEAEKMGIAAFEAENRALALRLFSGGELTKDDKDMLEYILSSGVYGTRNHRVENKLAQYGGNRLRYALYRFLVPLSEKHKLYASFARRFPFFYRHKLLLPLLPFYRVFRAVKSGRLQSEAEMLKNE